MSSSPIPKVRDDDPEDVSWALSTAATSFARGDRAEALKWLRRAAEAASEADRDSRALEIAKAAAELAPPSVPAPPPRPAAKPATKPAAKGAATPAPAPAPAPTPTPAPAKRAHGRASKPDETAKRQAVRHGHGHKSRSATNEDRTDTHVITEVTKLDARPTHPSAADADAWPTEAMDGEELEALHVVGSAAGATEVYGQERTRIGQPAYKPEAKETKAKTTAFRASQAVHVVVWRDGDGSLRIAPRGTTVSAVTIEALLVAPGPDVDLVAWLTPTT